MSGYPYKYYVPPTEDQNQFVIDETQQSTTGFPQDTFAQGSFDDIPYTMNYLQPTNPTVCNMAPSLSNWTGASGNFARTPYLGSAYGHGDYPPSQSQQQPALNANSYPYYHDSFVHPYDDGDGQTGYPASQTTVPFPGMGRQDDVVGSAYSGFAGEQTFVGATGPRDMSQYSHRSRGVATLPASNRPARTSTGTLEPLAPLGGGIPPRGRKRPPAKNTNAKIPGPAVEITYCTLELFSKWLASCEPHKRQASVEDLKDPDVRSSHKESRWDLGAFFRWAHKASGRQESIQLKICNRCFHTYGKFYPRREQVEEAACRCLPVNEARRAVESALPKEQQLGFRNANYFPEDQPQFLE